jgi:tectonic-1/3
VSSPSVNQTYTIKKQHQYTICVCQEVSTCQRTLPKGPPDFRALCLDAVSPLSPLGHAYTQFHLNPAAAAVVNATISTVTALNRSTGVLGAPAAGTTAAAPVFVAAAGAAPASCRGVVRRADYLIRYVFDGATGGAQLASVTVTLVVGDVLETDGAVEQAVSVSWAEAAAPAAALLPFSGAPGYLEGFPVLYGVRQAQGGKNAISRYAAGLQLPAAGAGGACDGGKTTPVGFAYSATSTCSKSLTAAQLSAFCAAGDASAAARAAAGQLLDAAVAGTASVGVWGNSDATNVNEWVPVAVTGWPPAAPTWSAAEQRCDGVVVGYELKLVTGVAFSTSNLQRKVVYAQLCPLLGSWAFDARAAGGGAGAAQAFGMRFGARFAALDQGKPAAALRPAPPLVVPLPPDLFYPFLQP